MTVFPEETSHNRVSHSCLKTRTSLQFQRTFQLSGAPHQCAKTRHNSTTTNQPWLTPRKSIGNVLGKHAPPRVFTTLRPSKQVENSVDCWQLKKTEIIAFDLLALVAKLLYDVHDGLWALYFALGSSEPTTNHPGVVNRLSVPQKWIMVTFWFRALFGGEFEHPRGFMLRIVLRNNEFVDHVQRRCHCGCNKPSTWTNVEYVYTSKQLLFVYCF